MISFFGYLSGGILSVLVSVWNGFLVGIIIAEVADYTTVGLIFMRLMHCPVEIIALSWFGGIGLLGFGNVKKIFLNKPIALSVLPSPEVLKKPSALLAVAAIVETSLFVFQI